MLGEFVYRTRVYCIKSTLDPVTPDEKEIKFKSIKEARQFFAYVASDPFVREELYEIAQWMRPTSCRPPRNCPQLTNQELVDLLYKRVYESGVGGGLRLVELVPPEPKLEFLFQECCVEAIKRIDLLVDNAKLIGIILCINTVHDIIRSHRKMPTLISQLSTLKTGTDSGTYDDLADTMIKIKVSIRLGVREIARREYFDHDKVNNERELGKYWKRIYDAANI